MDQHYIDILEYLEPYGIGISVSLNPILTSMFPVRTIAAMDESDIRKWYSDEGIKIKILLRSMENHITLTRSLDYIFFSRSEVNGEVVTLWLNNTPIVASLTPQGLEFLHSIRNQKQTQKLTESVIATNSATATLYSRQNRLYYVTLLIAVLSVVFPALSFLNDNRTSNMAKVIAIQRDSLTHLNTIVKQFKLSYDSLLWSINPKLKIKNRNSVYSPRR